MPWYAMDKIPPAIVAVIPDPSEPGRFKWHLFDTKNMPLNPVIMSDVKYSSEDEAKAAGDAAMAKEQC